MQDKNSIRAKALQVRGHLSEEIRNKKGAQIEEKLESLEAFKKANHVLFYFGVKEEVKTQFLIEKYITLKELYLPQVTNAEDFRALKINAPLKLQPGLKGVPEPLGDKEAKKLDIILVPGLVFDKRGHRLGTGKGYYDRFYKDFDFLITGSAKLELLQRAGDSMLGRYHLLHLLPLTPHEVEKKKPSPCTANFHKNYETLLKKTPLKQKTINSLL